ncbi:MAG: class C sortase [Eggerthellaceae bacterium]|nr:class C sortase [Eggerthellaceae bacterium]
MNTNSYAESKDNTSRQPNKVPVKKRFDWLTLVAALGIVVGLALLAAPIITDWHEAYKASKSIDTVVTIVDAMSAEEREQYLQQARAWNASLTGELSEDFDLWPYKKQLSFHDSPMMSWVEIPSIQVKEPVYHGTDESALAAGVGHLQASSLPVGGASSHLVLTAHSGIPTQRMFDDIQKLQVGDVFVLWTMDMPYAYEVTNWEVVLPEEAPQYLKIVEGEDLATLITCTPYGVNSHRLLVHGKRCEYVPQAAAPLGAYVNSRTQPFLIAISSLMVLSVVLFAVRRIRSRKKTTYSEK